MKYLIRFIVLIAKKAVVILLVIGLLVTAFTCAMNLSNMFILISDGLEMRANTILGNKDGAELYKFFSEDFLYNDTLLNDSPYAHYKISGSSYGLKFKTLWAWPWQTSATAVVEERVILEGYLLAAYQSEEQLASPDKIPAPYWENTRYELTLRKKNDGAWVITRMKKIEELPIATAQPLV